ncbi:MAG: type II toxin-antitoxin system HicB family antitoxin [Firmicutes bacterium]|nr:type II toxin-antitoxin system HicB family antitoxin [Bacillota bacterium]
MSKYFYPAIFMPEETGYSVSFPDLPGCFTEGDTLEEAYEMAFAALGLYLQGEGGAFAYPPAGNPADTVCEDGAFVALVEFDEAEYRRKHGLQLVKKTITIPAWVNASAERMGINFSATLTDTLVSMIQRQSA